MKIKTVSEMTGLSDRTIRYYIEEQLISPAYTENYLGRKSFDFSEEDIKTLKYVSTLRKFGFTVEEIRQITMDAKASSAIIFDVRQRTAESVSTGEEKLQALSKLYTTIPYTLEQLAEELSTPTVILPEQSEPTKRITTKTVFSFIKSLLTFVIVWLPILLSLLVIMISLNAFHYPVLNYRWIGWTLVSWLPSVGVLIFSKTKGKWKKRLLILCIFSIPFSFILSFGIISKSETTDFRNYRDFDADCLANRSSFFQDLFPTWPHYFINEKQEDGSYKAIYLDAYYYYCKRPALDYTYDIYAQWPLEKEKFDKEVTRVRELFETETQERENLKYEIVQRGNFTCLFAYDGDPPFQKATDSYTYYIFAYDDSNSVVRYIMCDSLENGVDQPYYLTLDW